MAVCKVHGVTWWETECTDGGSGLLKAPPTQTFTQGRAHKLIWLCLRGTQFSLQMESETWQRYTTVLPITVKQVFLSSLRQRRPYGRGTHLSRC